MWSRLEDAHGRSGYRYSRQRRSFLFIQKGQKQMYKVNVEGTANVVNIALGKEYSNDLFISVLSLRWAERLMAVM